MIRVRKATVDDAEGIAQVCADSWRDTYRELMPAETIERILTESYNPRRIRREIMNPAGWQGWWVVTEDGKVYGAGGGGMTSRNVCEIFILYVDPKRQGEGIGTRLMEAITEELKTQGAQEQWVSVAKGNTKGVPFYERCGFVQRGEQTAPGTREEEQIRALRYWRKL